MKILQVDESKFPLYFIETYTTDGWCRFTVEPFATKTEAENHRQNVIRQVGCSPAQIRLAEYTKEIWRKDLVEALLNDQHALHALLFALPSETMVQALVRS